MSLRQQIKQIDDVMQYILLVCNEAQNMERNVSDTVTFLRQKGLRTETADMIQQVFLGHISYELELMLNRMSKRDYIYLSNVKNNLEQALRR